MKNTYKFKDICTDCGDRIPDNYACNKEDESKLVCEECWVEWLGQEHDENLTTQ